MDSIPVTIKNIRQHYRISQEKLATLLNTSVRTVQHWEQGDYEPSGTAVRLIQILSMNDDIFAELERIKGRVTLMYLKHNDQKLTIMDVPFRNRQEYQATLDGFINNMYEGFEPTVTDVKMAQEANERGYAMTPEEILARLRSGNSVTNE
ncbi:helix-turn-helix domain-containing protein [Lactiplantibacillus carotarum]|uniref:helix-turn-helix domain-containing protein n=1 Tax=Lactiplantibacillus carotarum TaxID=2993456 RepID=UPI00298F2DA8|nr:helix-turn-helix domain-containing protein [Lactiplantibacillus carotarum]